MVYQCFFGTTVTNGLQYLRRVQDCAECKIVQSAKSYSAKLCRLQNVAGCKIVQSSKLCRVNNYAECEIVQCARFCCVQDCAKCKVMQSKDYASVFSQQCLMLKISKTSWRSISFIKGHYSIILRAWKLRCIQF